MQITSLLTNNDKGLGEHVDIEEYVRGSDIYIQLEPEEVDPILLHILGSRLVLEFVDVCGDERAVTLHNYEEV